LQFFSTEKYRISEIIFLEKSGKQSIIAISSRVNSEIAQT